jgi:hypothetical protein
VRDNHETSTLGACFVASVRAGACVGGRAGGAGGCELVWVNTLRPCTENQCASVHDNHETSTLGAHLVAFVHAGTCTGGSASRLGVFQCCVES